MVRTASYVNVKVKFRQYFFNRDEKVLIKNKLTTTTKMKINTVNFLVLDEDCNIYAAVLYGAKEP